MIGDFRIFIETQVPPILYHGTGAHKMKKIQQTGLRHDMEDFLRGWPGSENGVYLTPSRDAAINWVHMDGSGGQPVVISVSTAGLDPSKFKPDENELGSFIYSDTITPDHFLRM